MNFIKNGILHIGGKPAIAMGLSYYPSYHEQKVPVPPDGDRIGEMKKDLKGMVAAGFNLVRVAALGRVERNGDTVEVEFPFIDTLLEEAERQGISCMVRLQGYSMNLSGYEDTTMLDAAEQPMPVWWGWFVRNCLNHPGILKDNEDGTIVSAAHFSRFPAVVSFQIYNEPAYPTKGFYDYHPLSVSAYRTWLARTGVKTMEEASAVCPPKRRPAPGENPEDWVNWRQFCTQRMTWYLCHLADMAKRGYGFPENLTCHMAIPFMPGSAIAGEDYFETARRMDILGVTHYIPCRGPSYYAAAMILDGAESAAATFGKHAWLIEYNAHTRLSPNEWERETYTALGCGIKGILYYQWRADYPYADSPEPDGFGLLYNDGRKTVKFDRAIRMTAMVNRLSGLLASLEKARSGVGILYSGRANAWHDAMDNGAIDDVHECRDSFILHARRVYTDFCRQGMTVDFARACDLAANPLGIRLLLVPALEGLGCEELDSLDVFAEGGGVVYVFQYMTGGYVSWERGGILLGEWPDCPEYTAVNVLEMAGISPYPVVRGAPDVSVRVLIGVWQGIPLSVMALTNVDALERPVHNAILKLPGGSCTWACFVTPDIQCDLPVEQKEDGIEINLPPFGMGAFLVFSDRSINIWRGHCGTY